MNKNRLIEENAKIVNKNIKLKLKGNPKKLYDAAGHLIIHGGKRLRPHMVITSCKLLGGKTKDALQAASAIEMVHNFTLVHDDIMDNDEIRHGVPTVHKKFNIPIAILAGDVLFSKAYQVITESKLSTKDSTKLISRLAKACVDVCEGQLLDVNMAEGKKIPTNGEYISMIGKKTAALFDVSCAMGAICAGGKEKDILNLSAFGRNLGIAFQITDDLIGVMGDSKVTKKPVGNDLREGKKSLPILMAIKSSRGKNKKIILKAFGNPDISKNNLNEAIDVIRSLGIEENVRKQALRYAEKAKTALKNYDGQPKTELITLLDFVVKRSK
ncbi:MAG: polyprenyl synthetase family protein [Nitrosopumilus sp.]